MKSQTKYNPNKILTHILTGKIKKTVKDHPFITRPKRNVHIKATFLLTTER